MIVKLLALYEAYTKDEKGATAIEYGLIAAGISLAIVGVAFTFGTDLQNLFKDMSTAIKTRPVG